LSVIETDTADIFAFADIYISHSRLVAPGDRHSRDSSNRWILLNIILPVTRYEAIRHSTPARHRLHLCTHTHLPFVLLYTASNTDTHVQVSPARRRHDLYMPNYTWPISFVFSFWPVEEEKNTENKHCENCINRERTIYSNLLLTFFFGFGKRGLYPFLLSPHTTFTQQ
jgi:hypothetical protein